MARRGYDLSGDLRRVEFRGQSLPPEALRDRGTDVGTPLAVGLSQALWFGILLAAGVWYRHRPQVHKRLMLFAMIGLAFTPLLRLSGPLGAQLPVTILLLSVSAIHDRLTVGRIHPLSIWIPILTFTSMGVTASVIGPSPAWQRLTAWLTR